jgi:hypothetical protein
MFITSAVGTLIIYFATFLLGFNKKFSRIIENKSRDANFLEVISIQECRE